MATGWIGSTVWITSNPSNSDGEIERPVGAGVSVGVAERLRTRPRLENRPGYATSYATNRACGLRAPVRAAGGKQGTRGSRAARIARYPNLLELACAPRITLNRFIAINMSAFLRFII